MQAHTSMPQPAQTHAAATEHGAQPLGLGSRLALAELHATFTNSTGLSLTPHSDATATYGLTATRLQPGSQNTNYLIPPAPAKSTWESSKSKALLLLDERLQKLQQQEFQHARPEDDENSDPVNSASYTVRATSDLRTGIKVPDKQLGKHTHQASRAVVVDVLHEAANASHSTRTQGSRAHLQPALSDDYRQGQTGRASGAWEQQQARAILALEQERDSLLQQLDQYVWHKQQLVQLHAKHAKALKDAQGVAGQQLQAWKKSAAAMLAKRQLQRRVSRAIAMWRHEAQRTCQLRQAEDAWHIRMLQPLFVAWHALALEAKHKLLPAVLRAKQHEVLLAWAQQSMQLARLRRLGDRCASLRLRHLLWAWQDITLRWAHKAAASQRAAWHRQSTLLQKAWNTLRDAWCTAQQMHDLLALRLQRLRLRTCHQAWHQHVQRQCHITACVRRHRTHSMFLSWQRISHRLHHQRQRVTELHTRWFARKGRAALQFWSAFVMYSTDLRAAEQQLQLRVRLHSIKRAFRQLLRGVRLQQMEQSRAAWQLCTTWKAWRFTFCQRQRHQRVVAAAQAKQLLHVAKEAMHAWKLLAASRRVRLQVDDIARMQAYISQLQREAQQAHTEQFAAIALAHSQEARALAMEQAAQRSLMPLAGSLVGSHVQWYAVQPSSAHSSAPFMPRMQHHAHWLPGLQTARPVADAAPAPADFSLPRPRGGSMLTGSALSALSFGAPIKEDVVLAQDVLLVYGGVGEGSEWLQDLGSLTISHTSSGVDVQWSAVHVDTTTLPAGKLPCITGAASCSAGPTSFTVIGGFDGTQESMDIYLFQVGVSPNDTWNHAVRSAAADQHGAADPCGPDAATATPLHFSASVDLIQPRNSQLPPGRTGHSACHHWSSRSVLVFGGYASQLGGYLCDMWVLQMDTLTWWQPDTHGDCPPRRRGHVAAIIGNTLYVHGGYDGHSHFNDTWQCDLDTWTWCCVNQQGLLPCARRGHACTVIDERYILITGGYDSNHHLSDVHALDTTNGLWQQVNVSGSEFGELPSPCALHTLTCAGSSCVQLGGCGALGAMASCHLLQPRGLLAAQQQQQALALTIAQLAAAVARCGELQAAAEEAGWKLTEAQKQLQVVEQNCTQLVQQQHMVTQDMEELRQALGTQQAAARQTEQRAHDAEVSAHAAARRLARAREGGRQVAEAAQQLQAELQAADEVLEMQAQQLEEAQAQLACNQELVAQLTAQVQLLHVQLAAANNEVVILRSLGIPHPRAATPAAGDRLQAAQQDSGAEGETHLGTEDIAAQERIGAHRGSSTFLQEENTEVLTAQLAQAQVRALTAEQQLATADQRHSHMQAELAGLQDRVAQEVAARTAAAETAKAAIAQLHACQLQHSKEVEQLHAQLRSLQMQRWQGDLAMEARGHQMQGETAISTLQKQDDGAVDALRSLVIGGGQEHLNLGLG